MLNFHINFFLKLEIFIDFIFLNLKNDLEAVCFHNEKNNFKILLTIFQGGLLAYFTYNYLVY